MATNRDDLLDTWDAAWTDGLWYAPWSKVLDDLTPEQAAWAPVEGSAARHSIWQIVEHMVFWRDVAMRRATGQRVGDDEAKTCNFRTTPSPSPRMLDELRARFASAHDEVRTVIADPSSDLARLWPIPYHDSYHVGQIMYLRAMQGLKPIE